METVRAVSQAVCSTQKYHRKIKLAVVKQLESYAETYESILRSEYSAIEKSPKLLPTFFPFNSFSFVFCFLSQHVGISLSHPLENRSVSLCLSDIYGIVSFKQTLQNNIFT